MIAGKEVQMKAGDTQQFFFGKDDPPPWYEPSAPKNDTQTGKTDREGRVIVKEGCVGKTKGLWKDGMVKRLEEDAEDGLGLSMYHVLSDCWDFSTETTALMEKLRARGHIWLMCVKCHPELAGVHGR
jgi:hypothetical protein